MTNRRPRQTGGWPGQNLAWPKADIWRGFPKTKRVSFLEPVPTTAFRVEIQLQDLPGWQEGSTMVVAGTGVGAVTVLRRDISPPFLIGHQCPLAERQRRSLLQPSAVGATYL